MPPDGADLLPLLIRAARAGPDAVIDAVAELLEGLGFSQRRVRGERGAALFVRGAPRVVLSGHVDVVPAGEGWTRDAFGGDLAEGRVWGRGACDMLGSVAAMLEAAAWAVEVPCAILLTTDEETSMAAAARVVDEGWLEGAEAVVVGEPTHHEVGIAEKGVLWVRVATAGRNAHGSMPELGDNAAERLLRVLPRALDVRPAGEHPLLGRGTLNLGQLHGGEAVNQVPASAHADLDIRYLPSETDVALLQRLREAVASSGEPARVDVISSHVPFETSPERGLAREALEAVRAVRGEARAIGLPYGTEASKFAPAGLDVVILGPGEPALAHTNRESIAVEDLTSGARVYERLLRAYANGAARPDGGAAGRGGA